MGNLLRLYKEKKYFQQATANQHNHHFFEPDYFQVLEDKTKEFIDIKKEMMLKDDGTAEIIFDLSRLFRYIIAVANLGTEELSMTLSYSPDKQIYKQFGSRKIIKGSSLDTTKSDCLLRFVKLSFKGIKQGLITVYLQGYH